MEPVPGPRFDSADQSHGNRSDPGHKPTVDEVVDEWGRESFPASDPPGRLPPSIGEEE